MEPERWKQYKDTDYWVSDQGRVFRRWKSKDTEITGYRRTRKKSSNGKQIYVKFYGKEKTLKNIIWETFRGPIPEGMMVVHKNGAATMNDLYNLELITQKESGQRYGHMSKRRKIINLNTGKIYRGTRDAAAKLYISRQTVSDYCNGKIEKPAYRLAWISEE